MNSAAQRVADRYLIRLAARKATGGSVHRTASGERRLMAAVVEGLGEFFYLPMNRGRVAFGLGGLVKRLKQLYDAFKKAPKLWDAFKKMVGIESLTDVPGKLKDLAKAGYQTLRGWVTKLFNTWPLKIYTLEKGKLLSFNDLVDKFLLSNFPKVRAAILSGAAKIADFGEMVRKKAPVITGLTMVAIYIYVWINVMEFEWDFKALFDALTGALTFHDFLGSLPGSVMGLLLNGLGLGMFTLLPYTIAARLIYMVTHRYIEWTGKGFSIRWDQIKADFHDVEVPAGAPV